MIKEAFSKAADSLLWDSKNKLEILSSIKALQVSRSAVTQRCEVMAEDLTQQLRRDIADFECSDGVYRLRGERTFFRHSKTSWRKPPAPGV